MPMHYTIQVRTKENNWLGWPEKHHSLQKARQAERVARRGGFIPRIVRVEGDGAWKVVDEES
jgi:hypothetical protein